MVLRGVSLDCVEQVYDQRITPPADFSKTNPVHLNALATVSLPAAAAAPAVVASGAAACAARATWGVIPSAIAPVTHHIDACVGLLVFEMSQQCILLVPLPPRQFPYFLLLMVFFVRLQELSRAVGDDGGTVAVKWEELLPKVDLDFVQPLMKYNELRKTLKDNQCATCQLKDQHLAIAAKRMRVSGDCFDESFL